MWKPNEEFVDILLSMGISRNVAERALLNTGNSSAEIAATWIFDHPDLTLPDIPITVDEIEKLAGSVSLENMNGDTGGEEEDEELPEDYDGPYKMVFVVNMELGMGVGKIAAQVAHAALGLHRELIDKEMEISKECGPLSCWEDYDGERKIALKGENKQHLLDLMQKAKESGLLHYLVSDAGHTQVAPGSNTVLSIFGKESDVNEITGKLKLL
ncbi:probable peptidyl-tRNA hydrolase 2 isoform X1 [Daphnia pulicaria]|uniref:probable peptidyl-tRNA hydrolase 2 isoform X1 n=1 Tax=Daphnia pulicaria TaxID=35523 RepID=UPI001EE9E3AC|nr:probable peptidyl-tRNA hydrolase 2 isoform X1 [Daphnia pulicaria]